MLAPPLRSSRVAGRRRRRRARALLAAPPRLAAPRLIQDSLRLAEPPAVPCVCLHTPDGVEVNNKSMVLAAHSDSAPSDSSRCSFRIFKRVVISPALLLISLPVAWVQFCRGRGWLFSFLTAEPSHRQPDEALWTTNRLCAGAALQQDLGNVSGGQRGSLVVLSDCRSWHMATICFRVLAADNLFQGARGGGAS